MYSTIIFLLSDWSIWLGTPGYSCNPVTSMVAKASFSGYVVGRRKWPHSGKPGKRGCY